MQKSPDAFRSLRLLNESLHPTKIAVSKNRGYLLTQNYEAISEKDLNLICFELFPETED